MKVLRMQAAADTEENIAIAWSAREVVGLIAALIQAQISDFEAAQAHDWVALETQLHSALRAWKQERQAQCQGDKL